MISGEPIAQLKENFTMPPITRGDPVYVAYQPGDQPNSLRQWPQVHAHNYVGSAPEGAAMNSPHHLALLIAAPQPGETAMYRDQAAMVAALLARGFAADDILCLHGRLDRPLVLAALQAASRRVAGWTAGSRAGPLARSSSTSAATAFSPATCWKRRGPACSSRRATTAATTAICSGTTSLPRWPCRPGSG